MTLISLTDVELDMIHAISAADIAFIMSSSQAIVNWLNALDQSDFSLWVWCVIIDVTCKTILMSMDIAAAKSLDFLFLKSYVSIQ